MMWSDSAIHDGWNGRGSSRQLTQLGLDLSADSVLKIWKASSRRRNREPSSGWIWKRAPTSMPRWKSTSAHCGNTRTWESACRPISSARKKMCGPVAAAPLDPPGERRVQRTAGNRLPQKTDVDESYFALAQTMMAAQLSGQCLRAAFGTHDVALIRRLADQRKNRPRKRISKSRCSLAFRAKSRNDWRAKAIAQSCWWRMELTGTRGLCGGWRNAPQIYGSWREMYLPVIFEEVRMRVIGAGLRWSPWHFSACGAAQPAALETAFQWQGFDRLEARGARRNDGRGRAHSNARRDGPPLLDRGQIRELPLHVVYKMRDFNDNSGVFIRIPSSRGNRGCPCTTATKCKSTITRKTSNEDEYHITGRFIR